MARRMGRQKNRGWIDGCQMMETERYRENICDAENVA